MIKTSRGLAQVTACHLQHNDDWADSFESMLVQLDCKHRVEMALGDFSVECRDSMQNSEERAQWHTVVGALQSRGFVQSALNVEFTRRSEVDNIPHSKIDHVWTSASRQGVANASWNGAPGDHCWLFAPTTISVEKRVYPRATWRCAAWKSYYDYVEGHVPTSFAS